jgi:2C-methyl-D-erythritol 2,4-cyclodiphosphate synthase
MLNFKIIDSEKTYEIVNNKINEYNYRIGDLKLSIIYHKAKCYDLIQETKIINEECYDFLINNTNIQINDLINEVNRFEEMIKIYRSNKNA